MGNQQRKFAFRENCRQRIVSVGTIPYAANSTATPLEFPRVGLINGIILQVRGTLDYSAVPAAFQNLGPWALINRIKFGINLGSANIVDLSGYGAFIISCLTERSFRPDQSLGPAAALPPTGPPAMIAPDTDVHYLDLLTDPSFVSMTFFIPIAVNDAMGFSTGLINLQAPEVRAQLEITWNDHTQMTTNAVSFTGNMTVSYTYYEVPDPRTTEIPPLTLHRTLEENQAINTTGEQVYTLPRMGVLLQLAHVLNINGGRSSFVEEFNIRFNKTDNPYRLNRTVMRARQRLHLGVDLPFGVYLHDFFHATQEVTEGDLRDAIDTEAISTVESTLNIPAGTVLGVGNNNLISIRRILQDISQRSA